MLEIKNLNKSYGDRAVYKNFNLSLKEGGITCILGESGSGKTTLLNCLAGITECDGDLPKVKCSYVFQSPRLVPNLTVFKNLSLICPDEKRIDEMLSRVRLTDKRDRYPVSLSGGEAQRVALARAFLFNSSLLLMDEPFSSLDLKLKLQMEELFKEIYRADGRTAIFVTHDVDEAVRLGERIIIIKDGETANDFSAEEIKALTREGLRQKLISALIS